MTTTRRPTPRRGVFDAPYWEHVAAGELRLQRCASCGHYRYPPGPVCPECLTPECTWEPLSGQGSLLAWTVFHRQYFPEIEVPYVVVAVRAQEGPILIGNLAGASVGELTHNMPMRAVFEEVTGADGPWRICQWTPAPNRSHNEERA